MPLRSILLRQFRNYRQLDLSLDSGITVFTGANGIGKTTVLEAISLLSTGRSFRVGKNADFIHRNSEAGLIRGNIDESGLTSDVEVRIYPQSKKVFVDNKLIKSQRSLVDLLPSIVFSPGDHRIIEGDSTDRKLFLNRAAANVDWEYTDDLNGYNKALLQRNRILKDSSERNWGSTNFQDLLAPWDEQLISFGARLMARRNFYLTDLKPWATDEYSRVSLTRDQFELTYLPLGEEVPFSCDIEAEIKDIFSARLKDSLRRDCFSKSTQVGPHKDEILLTLNTNKVKFYGSQGEKRTCALALRLGELALFRQKVRKMPVLLFDDVSSELDSTRRRSLVELLRKENAQVLITATELPTSLLSDVGKNFEQLDLNTVGERT
jgi:DNA replication and repair protein RecF